MNDDQKCCQATPAGTLEAVFMNCNTPLSEREHWARNEIEQLKADRDVWRQKAIELGLEVAAADKLLKQCKEALYAIRDGAYGLWGEDIDLCNKTIDAIERELN